MPYWAYSNSIYLRLSRVAITSSLCSSELVNCFRVGSLSFIYHKGSQYDTSLSFQPPHHCCDIVSLSRLCRLLQHCQEWANNNCAYLLKLLALRFNFGFAGFRFLLQEAVDPPREDGSLLLYLVLHIIYIYCFLLISEYFLVLA